MWRFCAVTTPEIYSTYTRLHQLWDMIPGVSDGSVGRPKSRGMLAREIHITYRTGATLVVVVHAYLKADKRDKQSQQANRVIASIYYSL